MVLREVGGLYGIRGGGLYGIRGGGWYGIRGGGWYDIRGRWVGGMVLGEVGGLYKPYFLV